jgi:hypothetical protein
VYIAQVFRLHQIPEICPAEKVCGSSKFGKKYNDQS